MDNDIFFEIDGVEHCDEEAILAILLNANVLFCNSRQYIEPHDGSTQPYTIVLFVGCNDLFAWACADAESLTTDEIPKLYRAWLADKKWGASKWCCMKRREKPQKPIIERMKQDGAWDEAMESLE